MPSFTTADFIVDALTSNSLSVDLSMNAAGIFDNGTLFVYDTTTRAELANFTFTYSQFPITLLDLPTSQSADLEFTFSVGSTTSCGVGGVQTSDVILYTYDGTGGKHSFEIVYVTVESRAIKELFCSRKSICSCPFSKQKKTHSKFVEK